MNTPVDPESYLRTIEAALSESTPDHPHLPNFPYHVHVEEETNVHPDQPRSILNILTELEHAILNFGSS